MAFPKAEVFISQFQNSLTEVSNAMKLMHYDIIIHGSTLGHVSADEEEEIAAIDIKICDARISLIEAHERFVAFYTKCLLGEDDTDE